MFKSHRQRVPELEFEWIPKNVLNHCTIYLLSSLIWSIKITTCPLCALCHSSAGNRERLHIICIVRCRYNTSYTCLQKAPSCGREKHKDDYNKCGMTGLCKGYYGSTEVEYPTQTWRKEVSRKVSCKRWVYNESYIQTRLIRWKEAA